MSKSKIELSDINGQSWSVITSGCYSICEHCKKIDKDFSRSTVGYKCPVCGVPGDGSTSYYSLNVGLLIDLIQDIFWRGSASSNDEKTGAHLLDEVPSTTLGIIVLFSTLGEVLLSHFLDHYLLTFDIKYDIRERLYKDYRTENEKATKLFRAFSGIQLSTAVKHIDRRYDCTTWTDTLKTYLEIKKLRNKIVHRGHFYSVKDENIVEVVNSLPNLVKLFVELHNEFVHRKVHSSETL